MSAEQTPGVGDDDIRDPVAAHEPGRRGRPLIPEVTAEEALEYEEQHHSDHPHPEFKE